jgi:multicomponent K+:H+ antiporter subunit A
MLAQAGLFIRETFLGKPKDPEVHVRLAASRRHEAPFAMWLAPAIPAALSIILVILPGPKEEATLLSGAAQDAFGETVKVTFVLFHGLTVELLLSLVAISLGALIFFFRRPIRAWQDQFLPRLTFNTLYEWVATILDRAAYWATRLQQGRLRPYLMIMLIAAVLLVVGLSLSQTQDFSPELPSRAESQDFAPSRLPYLAWPHLDFGGGLLVLRVLAPFLVIAAAAATVVLRRDFSAVLALGALGLGIALIFVLEPAPDVALVQIVVDILSLVILVLALTRLPREQRTKAQLLTTTSRRARSEGVASWVWQDALLAGDVGLVVAALTFFAILERPRESVVTPYYASNAKPETGATDIVGAVVVDFRALDTLLEITVFSLAGLGIATLLYQAARTHGDNAPPEPHRDRMAFTTFGVGGKPLSPFIRTAAFVILPLSMMLAATHMMYGHDQPGDGFTAGVIVSLAIALWYIVFGYEETRRRLPWLRATIFIAAGILLAITTGLVAITVTGNFLGNVDFTAGYDRLLPRGFHVSTSFILELSICLAVIGGATHMLRSLGHPGEETEE